MQSVFYQISILILFYFSNSLEEIHISYDSELDAIIINGFYPNQMVKADYNISVYFGEVSTNPEVSEVIGNYESMDSKIIYIPKYGFSTGASYTVFVTSNTSAKSKAEHRFVIKIPEVKLDPSTYIKNVYPTASVLPMNQLKFYIEFSAPMRMGNAFEHIHLYRMPDKKLESEAFLVTTEELWNPDKTRMTILFDPGRIKRGIKSNLQLGLPLVDGNNYKLIIDKAWLDAKDVKLTTGYEKRFEVTSVDRESPNPEKWDISFPEIENKVPLRIDFKESMDYGLLHSTIAIVDPLNNQIEGKITLLKNESKWIFTPKKSWTQGNYKIIINTWLEDLSGNNLRRKFDRDLNNKNDIPKTSKEVIIPFEVN